MSMPPAVCSQQGRERWRASLNRLVLAAGVRHCKSVTVLLLGHKHALPIALREQPVTGATVQMDALEK